MNLLEYLKQYADVLCDEPLAKHTTFRIGGTCDYFVYPKTVLSFMRIMQLLKEQRFLFRFLARAATCCAVMMLITVLWSAWTAI